MHERKEQVKYCREMACMGHHMLPKPKDEKEDKARDMDFRTCSLCYLRKTSQKVHDKLQLESCTRSSDSESYALSRFHYTGFGTRLISIALFWGGSIWLGCPMVYQVERAWGGDSCCQGSVDDM